MAKKTVQRNEEIAREMYESFNRGDIDAVVARMHDDIEWIEPEGAVEGGTYRGTEAVVTEIFAPIEDQFETFTVEVEQYMDCGETTVIVGQYTGTTNAGDAFDIPYAHVARFEDGKLVRFQGHTDTVLWNEAIGAGS